MIWKFKTFKTTEYEKCPMLKTLFSAWCRIKCWRNGENKTYASCKKTPQTKNERTSGRPYENPIPLRIQSFVSLCIVGSMRMAAICVHIYGYWCVFERGDAKLYLLNTIIMCIGCVCVCVLLLSLSTVSEPEWKNIWFKSYYRGKCDSHVTS